MAISDRTLGHLIDLVGALGHSDLTTFLMRAGVSEGDPGPNGGSRANRATSAIRTAARRGRVAELVECSQSILNFGLGKDPGDETVTGLVGSLRADGWLAEAQADVSLDQWALRPRYRWAVQPLGTAELPLPPQMSSAEGELRNRGLDIAASHLGEAYRAFAAGDLEASNSQLRPAFEATVVAIAEARTTWRGGAGGLAIDAIARAGLFEKGEGDLVVGLWRMSHTNGSHPGLSNDAEALFRLTSVTALVRYLFARFL